MDWIRDYLISVISAAMLCGILTGLAGKKGSAAAVIKMICGLFLAFTVIKPAVNVRIDDFAHFADDLSSAADIAAADGEKMAEDTMAEVIKNKTQAYILDKADALGVKLKVDVILDGMIPAGVILQGTVSPYAKAQLASQIAQELGISPEEQQWII